MSLFPTGGDGGTTIKYVSRNIVRVVAGNVNVVDFKPGEVNVATKLVSAGLYSSADVSVSGGQAQSLMFAESHLLQSEFAEMTASVTVVTSSNTTHQAFTRVPVVRSGSILGLVIHTQDGTIKSGAFSASVTIDGANTALTLGANTGSTVGVTAAKDVYTFNGFQTIGVTLTASADYLCEPDVTSCSFLATVLVEM